MVGIQAYLVSIYQADLRREAARNRLLFDDTLSGELRYGGDHLARHGIGGWSHGGQLPAGQPGSGPDPRRALARVAAGVSRAAAGTARWLDPTIDDSALRRHASGAAGR